MRPAERARRGSFHNPREGLGSEIYSGATPESSVSAKRDLEWNDALPKITVDPETYEVTADGELLKCEPASVLPLAQRYSLF